MKNIFRHLIIVIIVCFFSSFSQVQNRLMIPGTRVSIIPANEYIIVQHSTFMVRITNDATLFIREIPSSLEESVNNFTNSKNLSEKGFTRISTPQEISIDGWKGIKVNYSQRQGLLSQLNILTQVFIIGDSVESVLITASYSDTLPIKKRDELIASIQTVKWDRSKKLNVMELNNFSIVPSGKFQLYKSDGESAIYTLNSMDLDSTREDPFMVIQLYNRPFSTMMPDEQTEQMMESIVFNFFPYVKNLNAVEFSKDTIDGIRTFETVFMGQHFNHDSSVSLYLTLYLHPVKNIALIGYSGLHHHDSLITIFKETMRSFERNKINLQAHNECYQLILNKKYKEATNCYNAIVKINPNSLSARLGYAEALRLSGKYENALKEYNYILQVDETLEEAHMGNARVHCTLKNYYDAEKDYDKALALNVRNVQAYFERSKVKMEYGNTDGSARDLDKAALINPNSVEIQLARAHTKVVMLDYDDALAGYNKAIELDEKNGSAYLQRGELRATMGNYRGALNDLNHAQNYISVTGNLNKQRGEVLMKIGEYDEAIKAFNLHLRYYKNDNEAIVLHGRTCGYWGKYQNALDDFSQVLKKDKNDGDALFYKGVFQFFKGKNKDAANDIRGSLRSFVDSDKRIWLFAAEAKAYSYDAALKNLRTYLNAIKTQPYQDLILSIRFALGEINEIQYINGIKKYIQTKSKKIQNEKLCDTYFTIGLITFTSGQKIGAKKYFQLCLDLKVEGNPNHHLANAYVKGALF
jgi:tetratricopeptide (TPR) repeat protein